MTGPGLPAPVLRPAGDGDLDVIAAIWWRGWRDGHVGHVPDELTDHRDLGDLRGRIADRLGDTTVAAVEGVVVGFVTVRADEIEQLYVDAPARGTGVAAALLAHGEAVLRVRYDRA